MTDAEGQQEYFLQLKKDEVAVLSAMDKEITANGEEEKSIQRFSAQSKRDFVAKYEWGLMLPFLQLTSYLRLFASTPPTLRMRAEIEEKRLTYFPAHTEQVAPTPPGTEPREIDVDVALEAKLFELAASVTEKIQNFSDKTRLEKYLALIQGLSSGSAANSE